MSNKVQVVEPHGDESGLITYFIRDIIGKLIDNPTIDANNYVHKI